MINRLNWALCVRVSLIDWNISESKLRANFVLFDILLLLLSTAVLSFFSPLNKNIGETSYLRSNSCVSHVHVVIVVAIAVLYLFCSLSLPLACRVVIAYTIFLDAWNRDSFQVLCGAYFRPNWYFIHHCVCIESYTFRIQIFTCRSLGGSFGCCCCW